ncbi:MAG: hypothetical protein ACXAEN_27260, partial [Candidatus Thorarchaeota archaeon]
MTVTNLLKLLGVDVGKKQRERQQESDFLGRQLNQAVDAGDVIGLRALMPSLQKAGYSKELLEDAETT